MRISLETDQDIKDFVRGCTFMGTGGGGLPEDGIRWLTSARDDGHTIAWVDGSDVPDDEYTVCPFLMGSIAPVTEETKKRMARFGLIEEKYKSIQAEAVKLLEKYMNVKTNVIVPIELGGGNTAGAVAAAARLGILAVDGDYTGRAIPEIPQTTPYLAGLPMWPISSTDRYGNHAIIEQSVGYEMVERMGKYIAAASFGLTGQAGFLIKGSEMKKVLIPGTLTKCLEIGRKIQVARKSGRDPVRDVIGYLNGWLLFEGKVTSKEPEDREDYFCGINTISGTKDFAGKEMKIWFKNENHISWIDNKPYVTSPDMIIVVERQTGEPLTNTVISAGQNVAVIGLKAIEQFRSPKGLGILGPKHFDFDIEYKPIERIVKSR
ncbi:MAG: DUF917 domain-containing protein [Spirochaetes bacterium]|nr:MAG: DUF917 domain-containing protein [Spirochaetota bacterium]